MDAIQAIRSRTSVREFDGAGIPRETLELLVDCGRLAPNGYNRQGWMFVAVTDREILARIAAEAEYGRFMKDAGACVAVFCAKGAETMIEDASAATENIIIAARSLGIGSCWVNSFRKAHSESVSRILACPEDLELVTLIGLGYPAEGRAAPKKSLAEVLRFDRF
jgi:nitroreductase